MDHKKGGFRAKERRTAEPVAIPTVMIGLVEAIIDLEVSNGAFTDEELQLHADRAGSVINGLADLLVAKGRFTARHLEIALEEYHSFVQARDQYSHLPPAMLFKVRRDRIRERIDLEDRAPIRLEPAI